MTSRCSNDVIGSSRCHGYDKAASEIDIGWTFLASCYWGGTYNGELKRLMLNHAFRFVDSVVMLVGLSNIRSQSAIEKIGGVRDGVRADGSGMESLVYRILASSDATAKRVNSNRDAYLHRDCVAAFR